MPAGAGEVADGRGDRRRAHAPERDAAHERALALSGISDVTSVSMNPGIALTVTPRPLSSSAATW